MYRINHKRKGVCQALQKICRLHLPSLHISKWPMIYFRSDNDAVSARWQSIMLNSVGPSCLVWSLVWSLVQCDAHPPCSRCRRCHRQSSRDSGRNGKGATAAFLNLSLSSFRKLCFKMGLKSKFIGEAKMTFFDHPYFFPWELCNCLSENFQPSPIFKPTMPLDVVFLRIYTVGHKNTRIFFCYIVYNTWPILIEIDMLCLR